MDELLVRALARVIVGIPVLLAALLPHPSTGGTQSSSAWTLYSFNNGGNLTAQAASPVTGNVAGFAMPTSPSAALLTTTQNAGDTQMVGDLTGKALDAGVGITITSGSPTLTYADRSNASACPRPPNVRLYFGTRRYSPNYVSGSNETSWWWSNPVSLPLTSLTSGDRSMTVALQPGLWTDALGHSGSDAAYSAGFAAAVRAVAQVGLSFGGGCYFDNGVGILPGTGSAILRLTSLTSG